MELTQLEKNISNKIEKLLPRKPDLNCSATSLHDSVWGSISLKAHEVAFINTKLVQRLRRIKQLGSAHLVFPGAVHTRFEHTLGVVHQTNKMCAGLKNNNENIIDDFELENLRFAALCHDIGHGPLSHYSESFFNTQEPFISNSITNSAEVMSVQIIRSQVFAKYCEDLNQAYQCNLDPNFIADAIAKKLPDDKYYLGEIISGAFDADKLDYLTRDGFNCGIPINIDTDRIYSSMTTCDYSENSTSKKRLAGHQSAVSALLQVINHKHHMYAVVYGHKISRIFRSMYLNALEHAVNNEVLINGNKLTCFSDLLDLDDEILFTPGITANSITANLFNELRNRNIFKIAVSFDKENIDDSQRSEFENTGKIKCNDIATKVDLPKEYVILDVAQRIKNYEAKNMLIINKGTPVTFGSLVDLQESGMPIYNNLEKHYLACPANKKDEVKKLASDLFQQLI